MWAFVTQKGMAMDNRFLAWEKTMCSMDFRVKIVTQNRTADAMYTDNQVVKMHQLFLETVQRPGIGSITVTAPCGCSYIFEKTEHHADRICGTHWVGSVFNGDIDE